jgi:hypothetical protein
MRVVIDVNVVIAALASPSSSAARIVDAWRAGAFEIVSSEATLREASAVLGASWVRRLAVESEICALLDELRGRTAIVEAAEIDGLALKDAGDRRLVEAAAAGRCDYLITADRELLRMRGHGFTEFLSAVEFCERVLDTVLTPAIRPSNL